jgi:hypothetical protein
VGDLKYESMPEGQIFNSFTYGKNKMGSYSYQLDARQRWMVIHFIKSRQAASKTGNGANTDSAAVGK